MGVLRFEVDGATHEQALGAEDPPEKWETEVDAHELREAGGRKSAKGGRRIGQEARALLHHFEAGDPQRLDDARSVRAIW
jgi:hypothetical protein